MFYQPLLKIWNQNLEIKTQVRKWRVRQISNLNKEVKLLKYNLVTFIIKS